MGLYRYWAVQHFSMRYFAAIDGEIDHLGHTWTKDQDKALRFCCPGDAMSWAQRHNLLNVMLPVAIDIDR